MTTLSNVITEIKDKGLEYIYIDEMGESGSIEYNHDIINRSTIENTFEVPLFDLNAYGKMCVVYIIKSDIIVGYVCGYKNFDDSYRDKNNNPYVYISYVEIKENNRRQGLCKLMIQLFLLSVNESEKQTRSFNLENTSGSTSCKCYFDAFTECEYLTYSYNNEPEEDGKELMTREMCDTRETAMAFVYRGLIGGKMKTNKKTKTRKNIHWSGWKTKSPNVKQRQIMLKKCGRKCFLGPKVSFPICNKNTCKKNKKGVYAAYIRSRQYRKSNKKNYAISKKAFKIIKNLNENKKID